MQRRTGGSIGAQPQQQDVLQDKEEPRVAETQDGVRAEWPVTKKPSQQRPQRQHIVGVNYAVGPKIGEGSFGVIFEGENVLARNRNTKGQQTQQSAPAGGPRCMGPVAIKFEPRHSDAPQLRDEFRAYRILAGCRGIPAAYYYGQEGMHNVLVLDLLGPSLEDLFEWCGRKFSIKTTCFCAKQMIARVRSIHEHDLIYRDIKPDNFLISQYQRVLPDGTTYKSYAGSCDGDPNLIYMVDFGMAKQYRDPRTKAHIPYRERKSLSGTARYMSINTHFGREQSRRDDLESLGHVFFYFLRGSLPWQGLKAPNNKSKYEKIGLTKQKIDPFDLLQNGQLPKQFAQYLKYTRSLKFEETPDYNYLINLMDDVLRERGLQEDGHYDWMDLNDGQGWDININKRTNLHGYGNANVKPQKNNDSKAAKNNINTDKRHGQNRDSQPTNNGYSPVDSASKPQLNTKQKLKLYKSLKDENVGNYHSIQLPDKGMTYDSMGTRLDHSRSKASANSNNNRQEREEQDGFCTRLCCCWFW